MNLVELCKRAKAAKDEVASRSTEQKNDALMFIADELVANSDRIIEANAVDVKRGQDNGMHQGLVDRLMLNEKRIEGMA